MAGEVLLNQNEKSMALLVSAHGQPSVSNMILKHYLKSLFWLPSFPCSLTVRGNQGEYSSKPLKYSIVERISVFKR